MRVQNQNQGSIGGSEPEPGEYSEGPGPGEYRVQDQGIGGSEPEPGEYSEGPGPGEYMRVQNQNQGSIVRVQNQNQGSIGGSRTRGV